MPSRFPGMDPYIEATGIWSSFHQLFLATCAEQLNERLPEGYAAILNERVQLLGDEDVDVSPKGTGPDVTVLRDPRAARAGDHVGTSVATLEAQTIAQSTVEWLDAPKQPFVEILRLPEHRVVTCVELLSPRNKRRGGEDRLAYLAKRRTTLFHRVHLVEVDLLVGGHRLPLLAPLPAGDYFAFISRRERSHQCEVYAWGVRDALPTIPIPIEPEDADVGLDLARAFSRVFDAGRLARLLRYAGAPPNGLSEPARSWVQERARAHAG